MLSPSGAGAIMQAARRALRSGAITCHDLAVLDALLWSCRAPGADRCTVALARLADLAGQAKGTALQAVQRLAGLGLIQIIKRRVRVAWGGAVASRQARNGYVFRAPRTGSTGRPADRGLKGRVPENAVSIIETPVDNHSPPLSDGLAAALAGLGRAIGAKLAGAG